MASFQILQYLQVRQTVITKLEMWIMNPKISRQAQDLLLSVAVNCCTHSQADIDVIGNFIKLRLKNSLSLRPKHKPRRTARMNLRNLRNPITTPFDPLRSHRESNSKRHRSSECPTEKWPSPQGEARYG